MKVAAVQHDIVWEDPPANFERLAPVIAGAAASDARLVVLTEMFATGFSMNAQAIAEPVDGPAHRFLARQAEAHGVWVAGSIPTDLADGGLPANQLVLAAPDGSAHHYEKIHPFSYTGEHEHYRAGDRFVTVDVEGLSVTLFVCYDLRFADEFWATAAGTDCYVVVANWPESRRLHWQALLRARAIENQAWVVGVNRVGRGGTLDYVGDSAIIDPLGEVVASAASTEALLVADVDPARVIDTRTRFPFLADRR